MTTAAHSSSRLGATSVRSTEIALIVAASALVATVGPAAPTGLVVLDVAYRAAVGALVAYAGSRAARWTWLVVAAGALVFAHEWWQLPAAAALVIAVVSTFDRHTSRRRGALVAGLAAQGLLHWSAFGSPSRQVLVAVATTVPLLASAYHRSPAFVRRRARIGALVVGVGLVVLAGPFLVTVVLARGEIQEGMSAARRGFETGASSGSNPSRELKQAAASIDRARRLVSGPWNAGARLVPGLGQQRVALSYASDVASELTAKAAEGVSTAGSGDLVLRNGRLDAHQVAAASTSFKAIGDALTDVEPRFRDPRLDDTWVIGPTKSLIDDLHSSVRGAGAHAHAALRAADGLPSLLGEGGRRRYLVLAIDPTVARGLGGVAGAYAHLTADGGKVTLDDSGSIQELDGGSRVRLDGPVGYLDRYGAYDPANHLGDVTYTPDLPDLLAVLSQVDHTVTRTRPLDGVVVVDGTSLAALAGDVGAADRSTSIAGLAAGGSDEEVGKRYAAALQTTLEQLLSTTTPDPAVFVRTLGPLARGGHLAMYSRHPDDERVLRSAGLTREIRPPGPTDVIGVTSQSVRADGMDKYLVRATKVTTEYNVAGTALSKVKITLQNTASKGSTRQWLTLYAGNDLVSARVNGKDFPIRTVDEGGALAISSFVDLGPGESKTLVYGVLGQLDQHGIYRTHVFDQPGPGQSSITYTVVTPSGYRATAIRNAARRSGRVVATVADGQQQDIAVSYAPGRQAVS